MKIIVDHVFQDILVDGMHRLRGGECLSVCGGKRGVVLGGFLVECDGFQCLSMHQVDKGLIVYASGKFLRGITKAEEIFFREIDAFFFFPVFADITQDVRDLESMPQRDGVGSCFRACAEECRTDNADTGGDLVSIAEQIIKGAAGGGSHVRSATIDDAYHGIEVDVVSVNELEDFFLKFIFWSDVFVFG